MLPTMINNHLSFQLCRNGFRRIVKRDVIIEIIIFNLQWSTYVFDSLLNTIIDAIYFFLREHPTYNSIHDQKLGTNVSPSCNVFMGKKLYPWKPKIVCQI
jgi:hypothetical protein